MKNINRIGKKTLIVHVEKKFLTRDESWDLANSEENGKKILAIKQQKVLNTGLKTKWIFRDPSHQKIATHFFDIKEVQVNYYGDKEYLKVSLPMKEIILNRTSGGHVLVSLEEHGVMNFYSFPNGVWAGNPVLLKSVRGEKEFLLFMNELKEVKEIIKKFKENMVKDLYQYDESLKFSDDGRYIIIDNREYHLCTVLMDVSEEGGIRWFYLYYKNNGFANTPEEACFKLKTLLSDNLRRRTLRQTLRSYTR